MAKKKSQKVRQEEQQIKKIAQVFSSHGVTVRRENLSRGNSFRVKSGNCKISGQRFLFIDKRMPLEHQRSVLIDHLIEENLPTEENELDFLPPSTQELIRSKKLAA